MTVRTECAVRTTDGGLHLVAGARRRVRRRWRALFRGDGGMSTAEYAIGTIAAAAFAGVLYAVVTGASVTDGLTSLIERALQDGVG
ncbi:DUF4244 domain-containing protein [Saccharopolyspora sp. 6V]|uniref:DUF4244 domain-containing protein n=1 Tax=Saccharopolyspora sp. 6V TaxID=2877239 RepID=UPI001CD4D116|nr:DUF4244 domain-containing protein [Saccharopolyspora sp. 6V]MCA1193220.1 DUF4244 domain-containing protein [Saccharopolyspora sp. 6V]